MRIDLNTGLITANRKEAVYFGLERYFNGNPCPKGHLSEREVKKSTCIECIREKEIKWRLSNKKLHNEKVRNWAKGNRQKARAIEDRYWADNKSKQATKNKKWKQNNPDYVRSINTKRRAMSKSAEGFFTVSDIAALKEKQNNQCVFCFRDTSIKYHVDHIKPLALGGSNWPSNLQILCPPCNLRKGIKTNEEFLGGMK